MKKSKIIAPALGVLVLSTAASISGTVAWFTANNSVSVTGMAFKTQVSSNLLVASSNTTADESQYAKELDLNTEATLLEPVSSVDASSFFYTTDANANGSKRQGNYTAYNAAATPSSSELEAFNGAYTTTGAVGFVDYSFYIKATNAAASAKELRLTDCNLLYNGAAITEKAWRAAMFVATGVQKNTAAANMGSLVTILAPANAAYFTAGKAVKTTTSVDTVSSLGTGAVVDSIAAHATEYNFITIRLWLEGEDTTCNNDTFANLTEDYSLDLTFTIDEQDNAVTQIASVVPPVPQP